MHIYTYIIDNNSYLYLYQVMQRWQQRQRQKVHDSIIINAKSNLRRYSNSREKSNSNTNTNNINNVNNTNASRTRIMGPNNHNSINNRQMPINKILEIFHLQQYAHLLSSFRFAYNLPNLQANSTLIAQIIQQVQQSDKQKFQSLLHTLIIMSKNIHNNSNNNSQPLSKQSKIKQRSRPSIGHPPMPYNNSVNNTNTNTSNNNNNNIHKTPSSVQQSSGSQSKFRVKVKSRAINMNNMNNIQHTPKMQRNFKQQAVQKHRHNNNNTKQQTSIQRTRRRRKSIGYNNSKQRAQDDTILIHNFQLCDKHTKTGNLTKIQQCSKIIKRLTTKIQHSQPIPLNSYNYFQNVQLQYKKISQMYLSFDSATLTSNIINIDLQQLTKCFAIQIVRLIQKYQVEDLAKTNSNKIKMLLRESFIVVKQQQKQRQQKLSNIVDNKQQSNQQHNNKQDNLGINSDYQQDSINQSYEQQKVDTNHNAITSIIQQHIPQSIIQMQLPSLDPDYDNEPQISQQLQSHNPQSVQIRKQTTQAMASSIWGNNYIASVINDFSCFDQIYQQDDHQFKKIKVQDVKGFVDLVMMGGKMEKQIPILAYVYLTRLLKQAYGARVTYRNWKNLTLITLIQASKTWDDRSLQNHSFSKLISPYSTLQINRLQKYLLFFIDYHLNIGQKQFSQSYFELRKHSGQSQHTANLVRLDLKTIKKLQIIQQTGRVNKYDEIQKSQFLKKCMNKSF